MFWSLCPLGCSGPNLFQRVVYYSCSEVVSDWILTEDLKTNWCGIHYSTTCTGGSYRIRFRLWTKQLAGHRLCWLREQTKSSYYVSLVFRGSWALSIHMLEKWNIEVLEFKENPTTQAMKTHEEMSRAAKITMCITPPFKAFFVIIPISWKSQGMYVCVFSHLRICEKVKRFGMRNFESKSNNNYMTMTKSTDLSFHIYKLRVTPLIGGFTIKEKNTTRLCKL